MIQESPESQALHTLQELGLTIDLEERVAVRIIAGLMIIDGRLFQGIYRRSEGPNSWQPIYDAYHVIAGEVVDANTPDEVIEHMIPQVVFGFSHRNQWRVAKHELEGVKACLQGPIMEWKGKKLLMRADIGDQPRKEKTLFPKRAAWVKQRLKERGWDHNEPTRHSGPDRKTMLKILNGEKVREEILEKLSSALSKRGTIIKPEDIPSD